MLIRALTIDNLAAIGEIDRHSFGSADQYDEQTYRTLLTDERYESTVMLNGENNVVGYVLLDLPRGRIRSIAVHPKFRRQGCGENVLRDVIRRATGDIDLLVDAENTDAIRLYERVGFKRAASDPSLPLKVRMLLAKNEGRS